jgi:hypothetical protein
MSYTEHDARTDWGEEDKDTMIETLVEWEAVHMTHEDLIQFFINNMTDFYKKPENERTLMDMENYRFSIANTEVVIDVN